jgi:hypothetical protein
MTQDAIDRRDYGKLEAQVEQLVKDVDALTKSVQSMRDLMEQSKGGWKTLVYLGGIAATVGGAANWLISHVRFG